jgi:rsbT co-antagonist protein RsbR
MMQRGKGYSIEVGRKRVEWDLEHGKLMSSGAQAVILWLRPSLLHIHYPLVNELGVQLFRLLIAYHSNLGAELDYRDMVTKLGATFEEGFLAWGEAVAASGWGKIELVMFDREAPRAVVRVRNPWELQMQAGVEERWGCPFLQGKIIGIFSLALGVNCWADELNTSIDDASSQVDFSIYTSTKTITSELNALRRSQKQETRRKLAVIAQELRESESRQRAIIASLGEVVYTLDPEGRFTHYHVPKELAALSSPPDEVLGSTVNEVFPQDVAAQLRAAIDEVLASDELRTLSYERERGGETRYFNAKMSCLRDEDGEAVGVSVIERDLTEQVLARRALADRLALIEQQREAIRAMSTPILQVWDGVLALPILGAVDQPRSVAITEDLLDAITKSRARLVILDLTGVESITAASLVHFGRIMGAAELLGAECFMCGLRPAVARMMAELGMDFGATRTFRTMQSALSVALRRGRRRTASAPRPRRSA